MTLLRDLAHARAGDKGDTSQISVIAYRAADYPLLLERVTVAQVRRLFGATVRGDIRRYELPAFNALLFVLDEALGSGVTRSLALDAHGKCFSGKLLGLPLKESHPGASRS